MSTVHSLIPVRATPIPHPAAHLHGEPGATVRSVSAALNNLRWPATGGGGLAFEAGGHPIWVKDFEFLRTQDSRFLLIGIRWDGNPFMHQNALQVFALTSLATTQIREILVRDRVFQAARIADRTGDFFVKGELCCLVPATGSAPKRFDAVFSIQVR